MPQRNQVQLHGLVRVCRLFRRNRLNSLLIWLVSLCRLGGMVVVSTLIRPLADQSGGLGDRVTIRSIQPKDEVVKTCRVCSYWKIGIVIFPSGRCPVQIIWDSIANRQGEILSSNGEGCFCNGDCLCNRVCGKGGGIFRCGGSQGNRSTSTNDHAGSVDFDDVTIAGGVIQITCTSGGSGEADGCVSVNQSGKGLIPGDYAVTLWILQNLWTCCHFHLHYLR